MVSESEERKIRKIREIRQIREIRVCPERLKAKEKMVGHRNRKGKTDR